MSVRIWWIRKDFRLLDNPALQAALEGGQPVVPVFILDPFFRSAQDTPRFNFLINALRSLDTDLRRHGSRLVIRLGSPLEAMTRLFKDTQAEAVFAEADLSPYSIKRDAELQASFPLQLLNGATVCHPLALVKQDGSPYTVFTPYSRTWKQAFFFNPELNEIPQSFPKTPEIFSAGLPDCPLPGEFNPSGKEANARLDQFLKHGLYAYAEQRDCLDLQGTSTLSPYLRLGLLSIRHVVNETQRAILNAPDESSRRSAETWLNELIWREFYQSILAHFPFVAHMAFRPQYRLIPWRESAGDLEAWQSGLTGYPVVDAGMRQLVSIGWMHNRARMITASFLVKDLLINWQAGEKWFMSHLVDGDLASNNGGWQWAAGVGTDAAPYFRIFNPILQGRKFDPQGVYIRRWLPELTNVPDQYIHQPWLMSESLQMQCHCRLGVDYPLPIVDHSLAKDRVLDAYRISREKTGKIG